MSKSKTRPKPSKRQLQIAAQRAAEQQRRRRLVIGSVATGIVVAVVVVVIIVVIATRPSAEVDFNGVALAEFDPNVAADAAVGTKAPLFVTKDLDDARVVVGGGGGPADTAKMIVFLGDDCASCRSDIETAAAWLEGNELPELVEIVVVSSGFAESAADYEELGWTSPVLLDDGVETTADLFGVTETPLWVVLDNNNFVATRRLGPLTPGDFEALVDLTSTAFI